MEKTLKSGNYSQRKDGTINTPIDVYLELIPPVRIRNKKESKYLTSAIAKMAINCPIGKGFYITIAPNDKVKDPAKTSLYQTKIYFAQAFGKEAFNIWLDETNTKLAVNRIK